MWKLAATGGSRGLCALLETRCLLSIPYQSNRFLSNFSDMRVVLSTNGVADHEGERRRSAVPTGSSAPLRGYHSTSMHGTTILCVRKDDMVVLMGDGQCTSSDMIVKPNAKKVRRIGEDVVAGFAGGVADGLTLLERLEEKLEEHPGQLKRAAVELAKMWRQEKTLKQLQAQLLVADTSTTLMVVGNGDVLEPHDGVMAIGSGGGLAQAAARALIDIPGHDAMAIARKAMKIAADSCIYTNHEVTWETLQIPSEGPGYVDLVKE